MSSQSLTVDLRELDWELLDSTDGLSDDEVLALASDFLIQQFRKLGANAETKLVSELQMSVSWHQGIEKTWGQSPSFLIRDEAIGRRKIWREIADLIHQSKQPLHLKSEHTPA